MPRLIGDQRLADIRDRSQSRAFAPAYRLLKKEAQAFLSTRMAPPTQPAGFYHNYFCPDHAVELVFDAASPHAHHCPRDRKVFSGEPYDSAWRWFVNNRLSTMAFKLALMWHIDQDDAYMRRAEQILVGYAKRYPDYPSSSHRTVGRGKATYQSLDEAVWLIPLIRAYDLIRQRLSATAQQQVEDNLLRAAAEHILGQKYYRIHNIECWHNTAIGAAGLCLDDADFTRIAANDEFGFHHQLAEGVLDDGLWWEGSSSYHFYALAALMTMAQVWEGVDDSLWKSPRLRQMFRAPVDLAYPDFTLPATNDCWFFSSLLEDVCHGVGPACSFYEVAYGWYKDPIFAWVLERNYARHARVCLEALLVGTELPTTCHGIRPITTNFKPSGFALLRSADPPEQQSCLLLKYGPHGGGHGHPDKLSVSLYAAGCPVSNDLGTPGYGIDINDSWYRQTLSHNTVTIDGRSQPPAEGELVRFDRGDERGFGVADARVVWNQKPYDGVTIRRIILWDQDYFLDFFLVKCRRPRQIDWVCRFRGRLTARQGLTEEQPIRLRVRPKTLYSC